MSDYSYEIGGVTLKPNALYQVIPKPDPDAPTPLKDAGSSKLLQNGIDERVPCIFNENFGAWDTGFYPESPCYLGKTSTEVKTAVKFAQDNIVKPYENIRGKDKLSHLKENAFWDNYGVTLRNGRVFSTNKAEDLLDLYIALLHKHIVKKGDENQHFAMKAKYCLVDKEAVTTVKEERQSLRMDAIFSFAELLKNDRDGLLLVLEYIGIISPMSKPADKDIKSLAMAYLEDPKKGAENVKRFVDTAALIGNDEKELQINSDLNKLFLKNKITKERSEYYIDGQLLGNTLKEGVHKVKTDPEIRALVNDALKTIEDKKK